MDAEALLLTVTDDSPKTSKDFAAEEIYWSPPLEGRGLKYSLKAREKKGIQCSVWQVEITRLKTWKSASKEPCEQPHFLEAAMHLTEWGIKDRRINDREWPPSTADSTWSKIQDLRKTLSEKRKSLAEKRKAPRKGLDWTAANNPKWSLTKHNKSLLLK